MNREFKLGDLIADKYRLERPLGEGAYGAVWKAKQEKLGRSVAIKFLKTGSLEEDADRRFEREARALGRLDHPNCVVLIDYGHHEEQAFLVTEYLAGETLHEWGHRDRDLVEVLDVTYQLLDALVHAHQMNIVHRDLKPGNVILTRDLDNAICVKVLDFGISSVVGEKRGDITKTGEIFGTPGFMSPEQLTGDSGIGPAADLYAVGVMLFQLIEGRPPFVAKSQIEAVLKHLTDEAPPLTKDVPDGLRTIVARLLEKEPEARYPSARSVQLALRDLPLARQPSVIEAPPPFVDSQVRAPVAPPPAPPTQPEPTVTITAPAASTGLDPGWFMMGAAIVAALILLVGWLIFPKQAESDGPVSPGRIAAALSTPAASTTATSELAAAAADGGLAHDALAQGPAAGRSDGCGKSFAGRGLTTSSSISGVEKTSVNVYVPSSYDPDHAYPFVLAFHDTLQAPRALLEQTGFDEMAERDGFILVLPEDDQILNAWRASDTHARARRELESVAGTLCLDLDQMYLYGHGGGGLAAEVIACSVGGVQALAVSAHRLGEGERPCKHPGVRYLLLAPTEDDRDPVEGGVGCLGGAKVSLAAHEDAYRRIHGCADDRQTVFTDGSSECYSWTCQTQFTSCHIDGGRPLPGGKPNVPCEGNASTFPYGERIWTFFNP